MDVQIKDVPVKKAMVRMVDYVSCNFNLAD